MREIRCAGCGPSSLKTDDPEAFKKHANYACISFRGLIKMPENGAHPPTRCCPAGPRWSRQCVSVGLPRQAFRSRAPTRVAHIDHRVHMAAASAALELDAKGQALLREAQHVVARDGTPCSGLQQAAVDALINVVGNRQFAQMVADATGESLTLRARARLGRCVEAARTLLLTAGSPSLLSHHRSQALSSSSRAAPGCSSSPHPTRRWPVRCHPP